MEDNESKPEETGAEKPQSGMPKASALTLLKKHSLLYGVIAVLAVMLCLSVFTDVFEFTGGAVSGEKVKLDFYVMSQCPYGTQVEDAIAPVLEKLGDSVDFSINFIASDNGDGTFDSLHGQPEVDEDLRQVCAMKLAPEKYVDYIICQNKDIRNAGSNWQACAADAGIDVEEMKTCSEGAEGKALLSASIKKAEAVDAQGSPTIFVNGNAYNSGRDSLAFQRELCKSLRTHPECASTPECAADADCTAEQDKDGKCNAGKCSYTEPAQFDVVVVNDAKCGTACDTTGVLTTTRTLFKGANIRTADVSSDEGKKLVADLGLQKAPAYLFSSAVTESAAWKAKPTLASAFEQKGEWLKLLDEAVGATYWIDAKARAEYVKSLGVVLGDNKPTVNLFVMSQCPYGVQAEDALKPVLDALGTIIEFRLNYIASASGDGFQSLHGQAEVDEDIRQVCAAKIAPNKYLNYIACQNKDAKNVGSNWEKCAVESGIDKSALKACAEGPEGKGLLSASIKQANLFGATGSPTINIDGEDYGGARTASAMQAAICAAFDGVKPEGCKAVFTDAAVAAPTGGCGV
ncbi:MAG TPA: hypothetical protein HA362_00945 [Nanoarchaeota archaeon]|nr:hypothetical protein [Nanoarchaeota archaeon]